MTPLTFEDGCSEIARVVAEFEPEFLDDGKVVTSTIKYIAFHGSSTIKYHQALAPSLFTTKWLLHALIASFNELGNPFIECSSELLTLDTKDIIK